MTLIVEWMLQPVDPTRAHAVDFYLSWHARIMVLAWGVIAPVAVLAARFFKILPWQSWPKELDNPAWWKIHWIGQSGAIALTFLGFGLILFSQEVGVSAHSHKVLGYIVLVFGCLQGLTGFLRGSKGGPTSPAPDGSLIGDHYDMTPHRLLFEAVHKSLGYGLIVVAFVCILMGLWAANAPRWMWLLIPGWWGFLIAAAVWLQLRVGSYDTYQAIWGADNTHPGNRMKKQGWGTVRPGDTMQVWGNKRKYNDS
ncbi:MAG: cytochrome b561 domain-containing protein [Roseibium sp.]|uniref:cytochrome b561 domain-containing protein n=1 Tax=Roseibium sp. TaxID=1936156 RepID=UPI002628857C|nr:cytochrome b561 domain-containing protein [Roseibium sp.]MCV0424177.1 cytochrome b561 domain-containing protein [Roseibium sp.]